MHTHIGHVEPPRRLFLDPPSLGSAAARERQWAASYDTREIRNVRDDGATASVCAYSWFGAVAVISNRLGGCSGFKLFLQPEDDLGGNACAIFSLCEKAE